MSKAKSAGRAVRAPLSSVARKAPSVGNSRRGDTRVFVHDLMLTAKIGLHQHERVASQRIRVNLDLAVVDNGPVDDDYAKVVCYGELVTGVRQVVGAGHVDLVETNIVSLCCFQQTSFRKRHRSALRSSASSSAADQRSSR